VHRIVASARWIAARLRGTPLRRFYNKKEEGGALVEYVLLVGLIAVVCIGAITLLGEDISSLFSRIALPVEGVAEPFDNGKEKGKGKN
jgi:pilus assembly protein Flp/PilA